MSNQAAGQGYSYPSTFTPHFRAEYSRPAVYRWRIHPGDQGAPESVYIGEAEVFVSRVQRLLTPSRAGKSGKTDRRLKKIFDAAISNGKSVFLDFADFGQFAINGIEFSQRELGDRFKRRFLENFCICLALKTGQPILNKDLEPAEKLRELLLRVPPRELRRFAKEKGIRRF